MGFSIRRNGSVGQKWHCRLYTSELRLATGSDYGGLGQYDKYMVGSYDIRSHTFSFGTTPERQNARTFDPFIHFDPAWWNDARMLWE
jgi:hypothetical protein